MQKLILLLALIMLTTTAYCDVSWMNGDNGTVPKGRLLTPNPDYWGENIATGVTYKYETPLIGQIDTSADEAEFAGKRLFDGIEFAYRFWGKGPTLQTPGIVVFDFQRKCKFTEIDLQTENKNLSINVEYSTDRNTWKKAFESVKSESKTFYRIPLNATGRYLRITLNADTSINVGEVWIWGDTKISEAQYKQQGLRSTLDLNTRESIPGIPDTLVSDQAFTEWKKELVKAEAANDKAVWSAADTWRSLATKPILPPANRINKPLSAMLCRNEVEPVAVYITNTNRTKIRTTKIGLSEFRDKKGNKTNQISGDVYAFAVLSSRAFGPTPTALISAANKPGNALLRKFCLNAASIMDFPTVRLSPAGSAILWIKIRTDNCKPGTYTAKLSATGIKPVDITVNVIDTTLPNSKLWINYWSVDMNMSPFRPMDWKEKEAAYRNEIGMRVIEGWPEQGSTAQALYKANRNTIFRIWGMGDYGYKLWSVGHMDLKYGIQDLTPADRENLKNIVRAHVEAAKKFNLDYSQWYLDTADEPNPKNMPLFSELVKICKEADPKAMIFMNPCGWLGLPDKVVEDDSTMYPAMQGWYEKYIDISVPGFLQLFNAPNSYKLYTAPRAFNAMYDVMGSKTRNDKEHGLINYPRYLSWLAAKNGFNGWAYYSIYEPRMNPWNDFDGSEPDYLTILPGPNGPVPTRGSEATREAYEDYCMLSLIKQRSPKAYDDLLQDWSVNGMYDSLRDKAIKILAGFQNK